MYVYTVLLHRLCLSFTFILTLAMQTCRRSCWNGWILNWKEGLNLVRKVSHFYCLSFILC